MTKLLNKFLIFCKALLGACLKSYYNAVPIQFVMKKNRCINKNVVISLTSYGRRVDSTLRYTLISLIRQTIQPNRITVWLDSNNWNQDNLPKKLIELEKYGVCFLFCDDMRSYKKLIPLLLTEHEEFIITCDDDLFYCRDMVKRLLEAQEKLPNTICCQLAHEIRSKDDNVLPYSEWPEEINDRIGPIVFPLGGSGCLYKKNLLYEDVCNYKLAQELAPTADDIWFYCMSILAGANHYVLPKKWNSCLPLDVFYQICHKGSSLMDSNLAEGRNDVQLKNILNFYNISLLPFLKRI